MKEKDFGVEVSNRINKDPNSTPDIIESIRFSLLFELYEQNLSKESLAEIKLLCTEIIQMTEQTPTQLKEDHNLEVDEFGKLI